MNRDERSSSPQRNQPVPGNAGCLLAGPLIVLLVTVFVTGRGLAGQLPVALDPAVTLGVYLVASLLSGLGVWSCLHPGKILRATLRSAILDAWLVASILITIVCPIWTALTLGGQMTVVPLVFLLGLTILVSLLLVALTSPRYFLPPVVERGACPEPDQPSRQGSPVSRAELDPNRDPASTGSQLATSGENQKDRRQATLDLDEETPFSQRWIRRTGPSGDELEGTLRVHFDSGQRTAGVDIPIVPAMASIPAVDCEPLEEETPVEILVRGIYTYGVRLEVQRPADRTLEEEITLAILIHSKS